MGDANNDIIAYILSRLPTKTLLRLKCVSTEWQRLMSEPCFILEKLKTKEPVSGFFFQERLRWCDDDIKKISYIKTPESNTTGGIKIQTDVFNFLPDYVVLLAVSNGLICCRTTLPSSQPVVYVCNPSNKEWVTLPWRGTGSKLISLGLVFDPDPVNKATHFQVVEIQQTLIEEGSDDDMDDDSDRFLFSFDIYSSKTRSWTKSKETCESYHNLYKNKGIYIRGGALFWLTDGNQILMFDTENDVARFVEPPVQITDCKGFPEMCIGESEDKLHYVLVSKEGILVWALEDFIMFNWELKYFVDLDEMERENYNLCNLRERVEMRMSISANPWMNPLVYKDGILFVRVSTKMFIYNFEKRKMEEVCQISDLGPNSMFTPIVLPYSMSLVPLSWP